MSNQPEGAGMDYRIVAAREHLEGLWWSELIAAQAGGQVPAELRQLVRRLLDARLTTASTEGVACSAAEAEAFAPFAKTLDGWNAGEGHTPPHPVTVVPPQVKRVRDDQPFTATTPSAPEEATSSPPPTLPDHAFGRRVRVTFALHLPGHANERVIDLQPGAEETMSVQIAHAALRIEVVATPDGRSSVTIQGGEPGSPHGGFTFQVQSPALWQVGR
jgi:hypothetical protein